MGNNTHRGRIVTTETELNCRQVTALLVDYVAGDMDEMTRMAFEAHLRHCPACTAFLATYRGTIYATRAIRDESVPAAMIDRVWQFLRRKIAGV